MLETVRKPNTFYAIGGSVVNPVELSRDIWDYYWTSYSRGTDGARERGPNINNVYLDGYNQQRVKSIYDPCPYGFRLPTNGFGNMFMTFLDWKLNSFVGGGKYVIEQKGTWLPSSGFRTSSVGVLSSIGYQSGYYSSTASTNNQSYAFDFRISQIIYNNNSAWQRSFAPSLRCIEDCNPNKKWRS